MHRRRQDWWCTLTFQVTILLAVWLAVAVPVACHHHAPQPLFMAGAHDHSAHPRLAGGAQVAPATRAARLAASTAPLDSTAATVSSAEDDDCAFLASQHVPLAAEWLTAPDGDLSPSLERREPRLVQRVAAAILAAPRSPPLSQDDPPPRSPLPASGA